MVNLASVFLHLQPCFCSFVWDRFQDLNRRTFDSKTVVELFHFGFLTAIFGLLPFVVNGDNRIDKGLYPLVTNGDNSVPSGYNPIDKPLSPPVGGIINCSANRI